MLFRQAASMSYYLALFGPHVDLAGIQGLRALADEQVPEGARRTLAQLAAAYALPGARMIVDETGDTAHELSSEPWEEPDGSFRLDSTRLDALARRAEERGASLAIWDACWDEPTSGPAALVASYAAWREHLSELGDLWDIGGLLCIPAGAGRSRGQMPTTSGPDPAGTGRSAMSAGRRLSFRDPGLRRGLGLCAALGIAASLGLQARVGYMLRELDWLPSDVAALQAAAWLTGLALFVGGVCLILATGFLRAFRGAIAAERSPAAARLVTGRPAVWLGRIGMSLALVLGLAGLALGSYSVWLAQSVVACAAKNL